MIINAQPIDFKQAKARYIELADYEKIEFHARRARALRRLFQEFKTFQLSSSSKIINCPNFFFAIVKIDMSFCILKI